MITGAVIGVAVGLFALIMKQIPLPGVPEWMSTVGPVAKVFGAAQHLGAWFPVGLVTTVILACLAINVVGFAIRLGRICLSLFTGGGGGAA